jgi:hypothetical protein
MIGQALPPASCRIERGCDSPKGSETGPQTNNGRPLRVFSKRISQRNSIT